MREAMVEEHLVARGITDEGILEAFLAVPRERFVRPEDVEHAYDDTALPIGGPGETISQPYVVAWMAQIAGVGPGRRVLEIGAGSGYAAAIFAAAGASVVSIERNPELAEAARRRVREWAVEIHAADGWDGWPAGAPYDAVIVAAAVTKASKAWKEQLAPGGCLVVPVGPPGHQVLHSWRDGVWTDHGAVGFVSLVRGTPELPV